MYIFVLEWTPALTPPEPAHEAAHIEDKAAIPHGFIFGSFMVSLSFVRCSFTEWCSSKENSLGIDSCAWSSYLVHFLVNSQILSELCLFDPKWLNKIVQGNCQWSGVFFFTGGHHDWVISLQTDVQIFLCRIVHEVKFDVFFKEKVDLRKLPCGVIDFAEECLPGAPFQCTLDENENWLGQKLQYFLL